MVAICTETLRSVCIPLSANRRNNKQRQSHGPAGSDSLCGLLPELESIYWTPLPLPVLEYLKISDCPKLRKLPFNYESAIENQVEMKLEEGVEWEDEATK